MIYRQGFAVALFRKQPGVLYHLGIFILLPDSKVLTAAWTVALINQGYLIQIVSDEAFRL
jgi:hypothetical protein